MATSMDNPRYNQDYEYDYDYADYEDDYLRQNITGVGLPAGQLALIIGVNAVISLLIAISVVLIAGRPAAPATPGALPPAAAGGVVAPELDAGALEVPDATPDLDNVQDRVAPDSTPVETVDYVVEPGDSLILIAEKFSVPLFDLMVANGLTDEDFIQAGQSLTIPVGGLPTATPTFTPQPIPTETPLPFDPPTPLPTDVEIPREPAATVGPSPTPTATPTASPSPAPIPTSTPPPFDEVNVVVNEVIGAGALDRETIVILNQGAGTSLKNWKLEGSSLAIFEFPDIFLFSGGSIRVHTAAGENTASDLYLSQGEPAWEPGGTIILKDDRDVEISRFKITADEG